MLRTMRRPIVKSHRNTHTHLIIAWIAGGLAGIRVDGGGGGFHYFGNSRYILYTGRG
jgi:hypothetical protein